MAQTELVSNTSPLLYLGRLGQIDLLPALFENVYIPKQVVLELDVGRLLRSDTVDPTDFSWATIVNVSRAEIADLPPNRLGSGEQAAIAYAQRHSGATIALDDRQARLLAERQNIPVIGTLGILLKARKAQILPEVRPLLDAVQQEGFRMDKALYKKVLDLANETI